MIIWRFEFRLNRLLVELVGLVIEKTKVAYLNSFPCACVVVKNTFQVTWGVASFQIQKSKVMNLGACSYRRF